MFDTEGFEPRFDPDRSGADNGSEISPNAGRKVDISHRERAHGASWLAVGVGLLISVGGLAILESYWPDPAGIRTAGAVVGLGLLFVVPGAWPGSPKWALWILVVMGGAGALVFLLALLAGALAGEGGSCCALVPLLVFLAIVAGAADGLKKERREPPGFPIEPVEAAPQPRDQYGEDERALGLPHSPGQRGRELEGANFKAPTPSRTNDHPSDSDRLK